MSENFKKMLEDINWFKLFIDDFEKALVFILTSRQVSNLSSSKVDERLL